MAEDLPIEITYEVEGEMVTKRFALLVVACDPRWLRPAMADVTELEQKVVDDLASHTFHTNLLRAEYQPTFGYAAKFDMDASQAAKGNVTAFRDEVRCRLDEKKRNEVVDAGGETVVTVYQFADEPLPQDDASQQRRREELKKIREEDMRKSWLSFQQRGEPVDSLLTDYFPHFTEDGLKAGLPWAVLAHQGARRTLYVSSFTCFESVLQVYQYCELLWGLPQVQVALPEAKDAPIAVVGAGPSGLLFASQQLQKKGCYSNVTLLEKTDRYGGKTKTSTVASPLPGQDDLPCELGTCYLSANYDVMESMMSDYDAEEDYPLWGKGFRSIVAAGTAETDLEKRDGVEFEEWVIRKNGGDNFFTDLIAQGKMLAKLVRYRFLHKALMGDTRPIPLSKPSESSRKQVFLPEGIADDLLRISFEDFLVKYDMEALLALLTYVYEVQGYGTMKEITAYYGMVWITPEMVDGIIEANLPFTSRSAPVTGLVKGWGYLWDQIVKKEKLNIVKNVDIKNITRV